MRYRIAAVAVALLLPLLGGCAGPDSATSPLTLSSTKVTVQLLRNSAGSLIPEEAIKFRESDSDESRSCSDDENSPVRAWKASVRFIIEAEFAAQSEQIASEIVNEYESNGWQSDKTVNGDTTTWAMQSDTILATLLVSAVGDPDGNGKGATIYVASTGPCVTTDGPDSTEVRELENRP